MTALPRRSFIRRCRLSHSLMVFSRLLPCWTSCACLSASLMSSASTCFCSASTVSLVDSAIVPVFFCSSAALAKWADSSAFSSASCFSMFLSSIVLLLWIGFCIPFDKRLQFVEEPASFRVVWFRLGNCRRGFRFASGGGLVFLVLVVVGWVTEKCSENVVEALHMAVSLFQCLHVGGAELAASLLLHLLAGHRLHVAVLFRSIVDV